MDLMNGEEIASINIFSMQEPSSFRAEQPKVGPARKTRDPVSLRCACGCNRLDPSQPQPSRPFGSTLSGSAGGGG